jgi:hypothetical protein
MKGKKSGKTAEVARVFLRKNTRKKAVLFAIKRLRFLGGVKRAGLAEIDLGRKAISGRNFGGFAL